MELLEEYQNKTLKLGLGNQFWIYFQENVIYEQIPAIQILIKGIQTFLAFSKTEPNGE